MRVAVVGSRSFKDYSRLENLLNSISPTQIISGGATGADSLAEEFASINDLPVTIFLPEWKRFGKAAGIIRNKEIVGASDMIVAFWDGESAGTKSSIDFAQKQGKIVKIVSYKNPAVESGKSLSLGFK